MARVKISNKAVAGMWYISNGEKRGMGVRYLWKTDLQWHSTVVDDYRKYPTNAFAHWPGYFKTEEEANDLYKQYVDSAPEDQTNG